MSDFQTGRQKSTPRWPLSSKLHNWGQAIAFEYWTIRSAIFGHTYSNFLSSSSKSSLTLALKRLALPLKELSKCNSTSASQGYQQRHGLCTLEGRRKQEAGGPSPSPPPDSGRNFKKNLLRTWITICLPPDFMNLRTVLLCIEKPSNFLQKENSGPTMYVHTTCVIFKDIWKRSGNIKFGDWKRMQWYSIQIRNSKLFQNM